MKIVFATNTTRQANEVLNNAGADVRLLSYWYLKTLSPEFLKAYVENGIGPAPKEMKNGRKQNYRTVKPHRSAGRVELVQASDRKGPVRSRAEPLLPIR